MKKFIAMAAAGLVTVSMAAALGAQPEFDMFFNNGLTEKFTQGSNWSSTAFSTNSIDIPVLVTYSIPAGKVVNFGFKVGPGNIVLDIRYLFDFTNTKGHVESNGSASDTEDLFTRRAIIIGAGYEIKF